MKKTPKIHDAESFDHGLKNAAFFQYLIIQQNRMRETFIMNQPRDERWDFKKKGERVARNDEREKKVSQRFSIWWHTELTVVSIKRIFKLVAVVLVV